MHHKIWMQMWIYNVRFLFGMLLMYSSAAKGVFLALSAKQGGLRYITTHVGVPTDLRGNALRSIRNR